MTTQRVRRHPFAHGGLHLVTLTVSLAALPGALSCESSAGSRPRGAATVEPVISGRVRDAAGRPLAGVLILAERAGRRATSDARGHYAISVPYGWSGNLEARHGQRTFTPQVRSYAGVQRSLDGEDFTVRSDETAAAEANEAPTAHDQTVETDEDQPARLTLSASDPEGDALRYAIVSLPQRGTLRDAGDGHVVVAADLPYELASNGSALVYAPQPNAHGVDAFRFRASDSAAESPVATVALVIRAVNDAPLAYDRRVAVARNTSKLINLAGSDVEGASLSFVIHSLPQRGTLRDPAAGAIVSVPYALAGGGDTVAYTPAADSSADDRFSFVANDGTADSEQAVVAIDVIPWAAPAGIPDPPFGIEQTHYMYAEATYDFGSGPEPYRDAGHGPYTHYVDNAHPDATDTGNPYGTPDRPRLTIPYDPPLPPGSVVEVHGGPYSYHIHTNNFKFGGDRLPLVAAGTAEKPVFVRGVAGPDRPTFSGSTKPIRPEGSYLIVENLDVSRPFDLRPKTDFADKVHHVVIRRCVIHNFNYTAIQLGWPHGLDSHPEWRDPTQLTDVVIYNNDIYDLGDWEQTGSSADYAGIFPHLNLLRAWIVDNRIYHIDGDGIQINTWGIYDDPEIHQPPTSVYIGRNDIFECQENVLDFKVCRDVVVSHNRLHGIHDHSASSDGTAIVVHEDSGTDTFPYPRRLWYLFNEVYDCDVGFRIQRSDDVYLIGNVIRDVISSYALLDSGYSSGGAIQCWDNNTIRMTNNVIYNCDLGILSANPSGALDLVNNLITDLTDNYAEQFGAPAYHIYINNRTVADASEMHHNLLYQADGPIRIRWDGDYRTILAFQAGSGKGAGCLEKSPLFANPAARDFHLQAHSPAIDAGTTDDVCYGEFLSRYGLDISVDRDGTPRPAPPTDLFDMGAYEWTSE